MIVSFAIFVLLFNYKHTNNMSKKKYTYYYPENKELAKCLEHGDLKRIASKSGYSYSAVNAMFLGFRKLSTKVLEVYNKIISQKEELNKLTV